MNGWPINVKRIFLLTLFSVIALCSLDAQDNFRVMFYNVENLFDIKDNPIKNDDDFTPEGTLHWSSYRYWRKLDNIGCVILEAGKMRPPALVGLCEVENDSVLFDLTKRTSLRHHRYEYIISDSEDERGINVALLYQRDEIKILETKEYPIDFGSLKPIKTRNILHVSGKIVNGDVLDIFICHFKSRSGGIKKTRPYRIQSAEFLRQKVDSIMIVRKNAKIIVMGDFNDYPDDTSIYDSLGAKGTGDNISGNGLYNLFYNQIKGKDSGSYKYRGKWFFPDQFIVSGNLLESKAKTHVNGNKAFVFTADYLLINGDKHGGLMPFRTYSGWKYLEGYSDHLPIYMDLTVEE